MAESLRPSAVFGAHLRAAREERGLSLRDLSAAMSHAGRPVSQASLTRLERGEREVGLDEALALAWWFGASPTSWLLPVGKTDVRVTRHDSADGRRMLAWLRFGFGSADHWLAELNEELPSLLERPARAYLKALKAGGDTDGASRLMVGTVVNYIKARKRFVERPKRHYGWDGRRKRPSG